MGASGGNFAWCSRDDQVKECVFLTTNRTNHTNDINRVPRLIRGFCVIRGQFFFLDYAAGWEKKQNLVLSA